MHFEEPRLVMELDNPIVRAPATRLTAVFHVALDPDRVAGGAAGGVGGRGQK
jgi:hypothetical protein